MFPFDVEKDEAVLWSDTEQPYLFNESQIYRSSICIKKHSRNKGWEVQNKNNFFLLMRQMILSI